METFGAVRDAARRKLAVADHLLTQTYPLVQDPKLLLTVLQNIAEAIDASITYALLHEAAAKRIANVPEGSGERLEAFRQTAARYGVPAEFFRFVEELRAVLLEHHTSAVEFVRKQQYVICDEAYRLRTLDEAALTRHVEKTKALLALIESKTEGGLS